MRPGFKAQFTFLLAAAGASVYAADAPRPGDAIDVVHYRVQLAIADTTDEIEGETEILFRFKSAGVQFLALDFAGLVTDGATEEGRPAAFRAEGERLTIALAGRYEAGDLGRVGVKYHGRPADGLILKQNKFGDRVVFADNWPTRGRFWFPGVHRPDDKATVDFFVTAPGGYDVVANGRLVETTSVANGRRVTHWSETVPIPTYCMVVGATRFEVVSPDPGPGAATDVPITYYLFPKDRERAIKGYGRVRQMVDFYTGLVGPFPYEKLALVQSTTRFGGMENASNVFLAEGMFDEGVVAHEIAHQWFGDSVTESDWHDLWLSEGFATYFSHLFYENADGPEALRRLMQADRESYFQKSPREPRPIHEPAVTDLHQLLNANNYQKGAWVLHMLRHVVGDEAFFDGIRAYYRRYRDGNASTADFQGVMERQAGQPLDWFFKEWIDEPGVPILDATWRWRARAKTLDLRVRQRQERVLFRMPVDFEITEGNRVRHEVIGLREREQRFTFRLDARPRGLRFDPDEHVLKVLTLREES